MTVGRAWLSTAATCWTATTHSPHPRERSYGPPRNTPRSPSAAPSAMAVGDSTGLLGTKPAQQNIALFRCRCGVAHPLPYRAACRGTGAPDKAWTTPPTASSLFGAKAWEDPPRLALAGLRRLWGFFPALQQNIAHFYSGGMNEVAASRTMTPSPGGASAAQIEKGDVRKRCRGAMPAHEGNGVTSGLDRSGEGRFWQEHI